MASFAKGRRSGISRLACCLLGLSLLALPALFADDSTSSRSHILNDVKYLASDELGGRGIGTTGLDQAADFIKSEFAKSGLDVTKVNGDAFQNFKMTTATVLGTPNTLTLRGPEERRIELKLGADFTPLQFGGSGPVNGDVVFLGYGIEAPDKKYDEFEGVDLKGKVALIMRREPQQGNPHGRFGNPHGGLSSHAEFKTKVAHAVDHGAVAVIFVDDPHSARDRLEQLKKQIAKFAETVAASAEEFEDVPADQPEKVAEARKKLSADVARMKGLKAELARGETDPLMRFETKGPEMARSIPLLQITRKLADEMLHGTLKKSLTEIEAEIDKDPKPQSAALTGWSVDGTVTIDRPQASVRNVIGVLEGTGPHAEETIVIGAHYDHLGMGGEGSLSPGVKEIHNGADDNASGTASLLELARRFGARKEKLPRRLIFIAFTGEEEGLFGSARYVKEPIVPIESTIAMFNMDMVGRLVDDKLTVFGSDTSPRWTPLLEKLGKEMGFKLTLKPEGFGPSDHTSFYARKIPVLHFFTGNHTDYHRPSDDWAKLNIEGIDRVTNLIEKVVLDTADEPEPPKYVAVKNTAVIAPAGSRPYFGSIPDFGTDKPGYALAGVSPGSPAERGGLKSEDRIVSLGKNKIDNLEDFDAALRKFAPGETVDVVVVRNDKEVTLKVTLDKPR